MVRSSRFSLSRAFLGASLLAAVVASTGSAAAASHDAGRMDIAAARHQAIGSTVTVDGTVSVPSGTFSSSFSDEGFAIQDRSGAGIYVSTTDNLGLGLKTRVHVTGVLQDSNGLLTLVPASSSDVTVKDHGRGPTFPGRFVRTGNVGPRNQGSIVTIVGKVTEAVMADGTFGSKLSVDDGSGPVRVFLNTSANIDSSKLTVGALVRITGFSGAFDTPELDPRSQRDIRIADDDDDDGHGNGDDDGHDGHGNGHGGHHG
ncbi:MAG TPA: hypothetical protein VGE98_09530 [Thermoanaerobaculia bacterium]